MLQITVPETELWNDKTQEFVELPEVTIRLEHSLVSLSKWEMKWKKPFLTREQKTHQEIVDYVRCMTITQNVPSDVYTRLTTENLKQVQDYIGDSMTATMIRERQQGGAGRNQIFTNERIYAMMVREGIPFECEKWHLNRLLTLIRVCSIDGQPGKKMSQKEILRDNWALNQARRAKLHTKG